MDLESFSVDLNKPYWIVLHEHGNDAVNTVFCFSCKKYVDFTEQEYQFTMDNDIRITSYNCKDCRENKQNNDLKDMIECYLISKKPC